MALDQRKRQKKLERRAAKRKAQTKSAQRHDPADVRWQFQKAAAAPVLHSVATDTLWTNGIGHVLLSRTTDRGQIAFSAFLVDMYCLGVKDVFWNIKFRSDVDSLVEKLQNTGKLVRLKPECARKLVEGSVEYARNLGFPPHDDYQRAKLIFGDINAGACTETFTYGKDGKPLFIAGPNDNSLRCRQIMNALHSRLGPDGYHYLVPLDEGELPEDMLEELDDEWEDDE
jgi:hypothetical protein